MTVIGNVGFEDELDSVSALDAATYTLGKALKPVGRGDGSLSLIDRVVH